MSSLWSFPMEISPAEERVLGKCKKAKLFILLRQYRHELFDETFQRELIGMYPDRKRGKAAIPPALLAMVTLLQAALGMSDEDAVECAAMDRRWQMVLGTLGQEEAPFSQGSLFHFRQRLIVAEMDRRLLERTVELARRTGVFGHAALRAAFDASPLFGAGRVEDTFNLIGHAVRDVLRTVAKRLEVDVETAAQRTGVPLVAGSSLKAALDIDWDDPAQKRAALNELLGQIRSLGAFLESELQEDLKQPPLSKQWATVGQILSQDLEPDPDHGGMRIRRGVAPDRRISIADGEMRHGRKSKAVRFDGYKRHIALDVESRLILGVSVTPGNRPEGEAAGVLFRDIEQQGLCVEELLIDRGYLAAQAVDERRRAGLPVRCKAFPLRNAGLFTKADFNLNFAAARVICPAGHARPLEFGRSAHFPASACDPCAQREQCTKARCGRHLSIHPQELFLSELRSAQRTPEGRALLRRRVPVEHGHARLGQTQGHKARYKGIRKNLFDLRRHAAVANIFKLAA